VNAANVWEYKVITIKGDVTGTWAKDNTTGLDIIWSLGAGSGASTAAGAAWNAGGFYNVTGAVQFVGSAVGATFALTNASVEKGGVATPFEVRPLQFEIKLCQRYFEVFHASGGGSTTSGYLFTTVNWTTKRASPSASKVSTTREVGVTGVSYFEDMSIYGCMFSINTAATGLVLNVVVGRADCEL